MELTRPVRRFFGIGKIMPERVKVAKCCTFLISRVCHECDKSKREMRFRVLDTENEACRECVRHTYKTAYGVECKSV